MSWLLYINVDNSFIVGACSGIGKLRSLYTIS